MERYDIAIIGTGPAGLEAAITAAIRNKKIILFGSRNLSCKVEKAHKIQNYLGLPNISGDQLREAFAAHLKAMDVEITEDRINAVYHMGSYYALMGEGTQYEASTVILATGVNRAESYPGEEKFLGRGVSYCATCDGPLYRGKTAAVIGFSPKEESEANFLAELAEKVFYFPLYEGTVNTADRVEVRYEKPVSVEGTQRVQRLVTDRNTYEVDGVFILRESIAPEQLVPGLEMEDGHIAADRRMETNLPGCYACGDAVGAPYQYIKAAGEGNIAALSAVAYLAERPQDAQGDGQRLAGLAGNAQEYSVGNTSAREDSRLKGKTILFLGSSVTYGSDAMGESFVDYLVKRDGIAAVKEAVSGTTLVDRRTEGGDSYIARMKRMDASVRADAFVCQLSTNDATQQLPVGSRSDGTEKNEFDTKTVAGAIEYVIAYAKETWNCPIIFYTGTRFEGRGSKEYQQMIELLYSLQEKWKIGILDLWNDEKMQEVSKEDYALYMSNGIHPTRAGYRNWWTPKFENFLTDYLNPAE